MGNTLITISLPDNLAAKVKRRAKEKHATISDYFANLAEEDTSSSPQDVILNAVVEGETEANKTQFTPEEIAEARARTLAVMEHGLSSDGKGRNWRREDLYEERLSRFGIR